jgi:hypothetical protein
MKKIGGLVVPADLYLELVRIYKEAPQEKVNRKLWIEAHRLECVAQRKLFEHQHPQRAKRHVEQEKFEK